jgi:hypothetical protein
MGRADPETVIRRLLSVWQLVAPLAGSVNLQKHWSAASSGHVIAPGDFNKVSKAYADATLIELIQLASVWHRRLVVPTDGCVSEALVCQVLA